MHTLLLSGCLIVNDKSEILLLFRKDHKHYETPGGKVERSECVNFAKPTLEELSNAALREANEELGNNIKLSKLEYFGCVSFQIPDGRYAVAHKFVAKLISGTPKIIEDNFERFDYLPIDILEFYNLSPDLKILVPRIKAYFIR